MPGATRLSVLFFVGLIGIGLPAAAAAYTSLASAPTSPQTTKVQIQMNAGITPGGNLGFSPTVVRVVIGVNNTVTWTDNDNSQDAQGYVPQHTISANNGTWGTAVSSPLNPGDNFTYTFTSPGTYPYHCNIHAWMTGTVIVLGTGTSSSTQTTTSKTSSTTTTPAPEFPLPFVALIAAIAACAVVYRLATESSTRIPRA